MAVKQTDANVLETLRARRLPPALLDLWEGRRAEAVPWSWSKPHTYFLGPEALWELVPGLSGLLPIVEQNGEAIIGVLPRDDLHLSRGAHRRHPCGDQSAPESFRSSRSRKADPRRWRRGRCGGWRPRSVAKVQARAR